MTSPKDVLPENEKNLAALAGFLCNHYLKHDITCSRGYVKKNIRDCEKATGIKIIPTDEEIRGTPEQRKELLRQLTSPGLYQYDHS